MGRKFSVVTFWLRVKTCNIQEWEMGLVNALTKILRDISFNKRTKKQF